jgi:hypothetical protein
MPPPRSRPQPDDSRSEASSTKEKLSTSTMAGLNGKGRRIAGSTATGSSLRDVITAAPNSTMTGGSGTANSDSNPGVCSHIRLWRNRSLKYFIDPMVNLWSFDTSRISIWLPLKYACRIQQNLQPTRTLSITHGADVAYNGPAERTTEARQRPASKCCTKTFQQYGHHWEWSCGWFPV